MAQILKIVLIVTLFFNFALPKAGTKIGTIPVYVALIPLLLLFLPLLFIKTIEKKDANDQRLVLIFFISFIALSVMNFIVFQPVLGLFTLIGNNLPFIIALTAIFFIFLFDIIPLKSETFLKILIISASVVIGYALIQKIFGEINVIIPGITFNYDEASRLIGSTHNYRWDKSNYLPSIDYLKVASTYQNGNLFGVNLVLFFWLAFAALWANKKLWTNIFAVLLFIGFSIACVFTASGTVYIGYMASVGMLYIYILMGIIRSKRANKIREIIMMAAIPLVFVGGIIVLTQFSPEFKTLIFERLVGRNLLGNERFSNFAPYLTYLWEKKLVFQFLFGSLFDPVRLGGAYEITLTAIFMNFGILFTLFFTGVIFHFLSRIQFALYSFGIWAYVIMSFIDGAFWLPPTPFTFFILLGYCMNLSKQEKHNTIANHQ